MIETSSDLPWKSSEIFGYLRKSSIIFDNVGKFSENVEKCSCGLRTTFKESYESVRKSSDKSSKTSLLAFSYNKQDDT